jgi:isoquinoline 1-oxidoreductase
LTKGQKIERHLDVKPILKDVAKFKISGQPLLRRDSREKVTGKAKYAGDIRLPGMLYAKILRPPSHGAKLKHADLTAARAVSGVLVVEEKNLIAVLHELPDIAENALDKIVAEFEPSPLTVDDTTIYDHLSKASVAPRIASQAGNLDEGQKLAQRTFKKTYFNAYVAHAAMETHTALARIEGDKATIWASTQNPFGLRDEIAQVLGLPVPNVRVITPFVGGGFGGKSANGQAVEAARLAKATDRPVQVAWSREEEFFNDTFRPAAVVNISSGLDAEGKMTFWDYEVRFAGDRGAAHYYAIPNHRTSSVGGFNGPAGYHPFAVGAWRGPGNNTNTFARESHIDLMAAAAGVDPIEFRLRHLTDPRMIRVVKAAAEHFDWKPMKGPSGRGLGVACCIDAGTYVAAIAQVEVDRAKGSVAVKRILCVQEMGVVVNPAGAKIQMEGCITMGLGYALSEEIHFKGGTLSDTNFDTYTIPRFSWVPKMETIILEANDIAPQGGGEPAIILMGAVIANAIHDAISVRLVNLPMTPARIKAALQEAKT